MNREDPSCAAEPVVRATIEYLSNAVLTKRRRTHDARLHSHIEIRLPEDRQGMLLKDAIDRNQLGMPRSLELLQ